MQIKMLETKQASPNGVDINLYEKGRTYDLPDKLAADLILVGWAEEVMPETPDQDNVGAGPGAGPDQDEKEQKDSGAAPENKTSFLQKLVGK